MKTFYSVMSLVLLISGSSAVNLRAEDEAAAVAPTVAEPAETEVVAEPAETPGYVRILDSWATSPDELFRPVSYQDVSAPDVALPGFQAAPVNRGRRLFGSSSGNRSLLSANRRALSNQPGTSVVLGSESKGRQTTDVGRLLGKSSASLGIATEKRSPIVTDVRVRGSQMSQLLASGSYWFPVRPDLDTLLSKVDSSLIEDVLVIKGPYSSRYGPGYNFVDFELVQTPRYDNGYEVHGSSSLNYNTNGEQWRGRQAFWGGDSDYGFRVGYVHQAGVDYETGDGVKLPSGYKSGNLDVAFGFDLDDQRSVEFQYMRLDQSDLQLPNQINTIDFLATDSYELTFTEHDGDLADVLEFETWYNITRLQGGSNDPGKRTQIPLLDATNFVNDIEGWNTSTGFNLGLTWFGDGGQTLTAGVDFRYLMAEYNEVGRTDFQFPQGMSPLANFPLPPSYTANPGLYFEHVNPVTNDLTIRTGGRFDWINMNASTDAEGLTAVATFGDPVDVFVGGFPGSFDQSFELGQAFITADYVVDPNVTLNAGTGFGMRAPTMSEMYQVGSYATVMPQFVLTAPLGNPLLNPEKRYQIDLGATFDYDDFRGGVNLYHAWILDYITLDRAGGNPTFAAPIQPAYGYTNTDLATLAGFETFAEQDLNQWFTAFGNLSYTEGRDHS